jgi:isopentenyl-diphosphate delta-isomerase
MQEVILVDKNDRKIGLEEKMKAHRLGKLHRAISVYIFDSDGRIMMQQRAKGKYHSGLLWSNTCCTNCYKGETASGSAHRALKDEMGFDCKLNEAFSTIYKTKVGGGLTENEFLRVFFGNYSKNPRINRKEAKSWKLMSLKELKSDVKRNPENYTSWLKILLGRKELSSNIAKFTESRINR